VKTVASPIRLSKTPVAYDAAPPALGQDTDEVLGELGLGSDRLEALKARGVI
jgi:crotonobetainyl-CoA:carnitine CoA-transferase CaiB-like acyl-CoA transferase